MPRFNIRHITRYSYDQPVRDSANQIILFPITDDHQQLIQQTLTITGDPPVEKFKDYYGNEIGSFTYAEPHVQLVIDSAIEVEVKAKPVPADQQPAAEQWLMLAQVKSTYPFIDFTSSEHFTGAAELRALPLLANPKSQTPLQFALKATEYVYKNFSYDQAVTDVETTLEEIWKLKAGVCQDFAHILLVMLRFSGIPARYVSGYICPNKSGLRGEGATHAWVEAYLPFYGWAGFDPTNNCIVTDQHVRLATGRNFSDVSPVRGSYKGTANHVLEVGVTVSYEDGSVSKETPTVMVPQPAKGSAPGESNSYRRHIEMMQQQQQ